MRHNTFYTKIAIGVSACLVGEKVRYDGTHRRDPWVARTLGRHVKLVPLCPEVSIGLGSPRPPIGLVGDPADPRVVGVGDPALDVTAALSRFGRDVAAMPDALSGYVFKSRSPSCGVWRVPVRRPRGISRTGRGGYAAALMAACPLLPVEEEEGLADPARRDNFLERVFAYRRWRQFLERGPTPSRLVEFHAAHKLQLLSHGESRYRSLGRLVARAGAGSISLLARDYGVRFMGALSIAATRSLHTNALQHAAGFLKCALDAADKAELDLAIASYRRGRCSWLVPAALIRHVVRRDKAAHGWIVLQTYLDPSPVELALRNFAGPR